MSTEVKPKNGTNGDSGNKMPVSAQLRLGVIMLRTTTLALGGWLVTVGTKPLVEVLWSEWGGLLVLLIGAASSSFLEYTSGTWSRTKEAVGELVVQPPIPPDKQA